MSQPPLDPTDAAVEAFLTRWKGSGGSERASFQPYMSELCRLLGVPEPDPPTTSDQADSYVFEKYIWTQADSGKQGTPERADLYKRGCFLAEGKQGSDTSTPGEFSSVDAGKVRKGTARRDTRAWYQVMVEAHSQALRYVRFLQPDHPKPPFVLVVDVGHCIEVSADFSGNGQLYVAFPSQTGYRIYHDDPAGTGRPTLRSPEVRKMLRQIWLDPHSLDPSKIAAEVTRKIAADLGKLAQSLEQSQLSPGLVAQFLMRCLFSMFAEDVGLLPPESFRKELEACRGRADRFQRRISHLWGEMDAGGYSVVLDANLLRFNGQLFKDAEALRLSEEQLEMLIVAAKADWRNVEPAIFGTLLERALSDRDRHKLGAHYTPRAYVERLILPTVIEPLRQEWDLARAEAIQLDRAGKTKEAIAAVRAFHTRLCKLRVLDPACGSGNFLYVTLEHCKRLEGEVLQMLVDLGYAQQGLDMESLTVDPHQFLGIEVNPRAASIAEMVLWIGYLQWHFRTHGKVNPPAPVLRNYGNIQCRDAVLAWDGEPELVVDEAGRPVTRWDGVSTKKHPVTGNDVPDEEKRALQYRYRNPRKAEWPEADFVVGNPPFIGNKRMRDALGDGYVEALRGAWPDVPETVDLVMYWWHAAAKLLETKNIARFGFITTNSLRTAHSRPVVQRALTAGAALAFAVPDHPWVDAKDGAAVRVSMTVLGRDKSAGVFALAIESGVGPGGEVRVQLETKRGEIQADLRCGANVSGAAPLLSNSSIALQGIIPLGEGFRLTPDAAASLGLMGSQEQQYLRRYRIGRDVVQRPEDKYVIDFFGLSAEQASAAAPTCFQHLLTHVKPERDTNRRETRRLNWWIFGENAPKFRSAVKGLSRYIVTVDTSKFKPFVFMDPDVLPDRRVQAVCSSDAAVLAVLSSKPHQLWALAAGGRLGVGNDPTWTNTTCFLPFPFPTATPTQLTAIRTLGERLDAHRKSRQALYPDLTLTGMYNVLEALRASRALTPKEKLIHDQALCGLLLQLHNDLDAAVFDAYGWPHDLDDESILQRLVDLNAERAEEERRGLIRWLRPEYQNPQGTAAASNRELDLSADTADDEAEAAPAAITAAVPAWPKLLPERFQAVQKALHATRPQQLDELARQWKGCKREDLQETLATLQVLGKARGVEGGWVVG